MLSAFRIAFKALNRNKMRSALTTLGIIIGVGAVIAMVGIAQGAKASTEEAIKKLGTNSLMVFPGSITRTGVRTGFGSTITLIAEDAKAIEKECPAVALVSPGTRTTAQVVYANQNWFTAINGVGPAYQEIRAWPVESGRFITSQDVDAVAKVAIVGKTVVENLFSGGDPIGQIIRIKKVPFMVVGVLSSKGQVMGRDQDDVILIPYTTAQSRIMGITHVNDISISAISEKASQEAQTQITELLRKRHRIQPGQEDDFSVRSQLETAAAAEESSRTMTMLLASIASVSLVVGGIGIMNIMLVSVTERTHEIGIRMAVGAQEKDILLQFLIEAIVLSLVGGVIGIGAGILSARLISHLAGWPTVISPASMILSFIFAGLVGIFFGLYPARKASRLDPIEALRYE
jgi:putative ABC transport system permease protein